MSGMKLIRARQMLAVSWRLPMMLSGETARLALHVICDVKFVVGMAPGALQDNMFLRCPHDVTSEV